MLGAGFFRSPHQSSTGHLDGTQTPGALPGSTTAFPPGPSFALRSAGHYGLVRGRRGCRPTRSGRRLLPLLTSIGARGCPTPPQDPWPKVSTMSSSEEEEEDDAYYDLAQPTVTTSRSAASTIILNRLDDLEFSLTGCDYDHTERDRRRAVAKLTDAAARNPCLLYTSPSPRDRG